MVGWKQPQTDTLAHIDMRQTTQRPYLLRGLLGLLLGFAVVWANQRASGGGTTMKQRHTHHRPPSFSSSRIGCSPGQLRV